MKVSKFCLLTSVFLLCVPTVSSNRDGGFIWQGNERVLNVSSLIALETASFVTSEDVKNRYQYNGFSETKGYLKYDLAVDLAMSSTTYYLSLSVLKSDLDVGSYHLSIFADETADVIYSDDLSGYADVFDQNKLDIYFDITDETLSESLLTISKIDLLSFPIDYGGEIDLSARPSAFEEIAEMWNLTFAKSGFFTLVKVDTTEEVSSIYDDLDKAGIDYSLYKIGAVDKNKMITLLESVKDQVFIYVYRTDPANTYNKIDLSTDSDIVNDMSNSKIFKTYNLKEVDSTDYIVKYIVSNFTSNTKLDERRISVRQVYNSKTKDNIKAIIPVAMEYLVHTKDDGSKVYKVNKVDSVIVTDKTVGYELFKNGGIVDTQKCLDSTVCQQGLDFIDRYGYSDGFNKASQYIQRNFVAFNLDIPVDSILSIDVKYNYEIYTGLTDIVSHALSPEHSLVGKNLNSSSFLKDHKTYSKSDLLSAYKTVKPEFINYSYGHWNKTIKSSFSTIQEISTIDNVSEELKPYTWLVSFKNNDIVDSNAHVSLTEYRRFVHNYHDITDVSLMEFTYMQDGIEKSAVLIDSYNDSEGEKPIEKPEQFNLFQQIYRSFSRLFTGQADLGDYIVCLTTTVIGIIALFLLLKLLVLIIEIFKR